MYTEGGYLRVMVPRTTNGINPIQDERGQAQYKEVHLPLTAKTELERINSKLPGHLKRRIEHVLPVMEEKQPAKTVETPPAQIPTQKPAEIKTTEQPQPKTVEPVPTTQPTKQAETQPAK